MFMFMFQRISIIFEGTLWGDKESISRPNPLQGKSKVVICNHQPDCPTYLWPDS